MTKLVRPGKKVDAVHRLIRGEEAEAIAGSLGVDAERVELWHKTFVNAGKRAVRYTMEELERPTLDDIAASAQRAFPSRLMHEFDSAACFFVAQFFGKNDVIHIYASGIPDVTLVDLDEPKLDHMREIYPDDWKVHCEDAAAAAKRFQEAGRVFDLVVLDPYSGFMNRLLEDQLQPFRAITGKCMMHFLTRDEIATLGGKDDLESLAAAYRKLDPSANLVDLIKRSNHRGGVYWAVLRFDS